MFELVFGTLQDILERLVGVQCAASTEVCCSGNVYKLLVQLYAILPCSSSSLLIPTQAAAKEHRKDIAALRAETKQKIEHTTTGVEAACPSPATYFILTVLKAGETLCKAPFGRKTV